MASSCYLSWRSGQFFRNAELEYNADLGYIDFVHLYAAGSLTANRSPGSLSVYLPQPFPESVTRAFPKGLLHTYPSLEYPPFILVLLKPLGLLTLQQAFLVWLLAAAVALVATILLVSKAYARHGVRAAYLLVGSLASFPVFAVFRVGQTTMFFTLILAVCFYLMRKSRYFTTGLLSSLCFIKPQFAPIVLVSGVATRMSQL